MFAILTARHHALVAYSLTAVVVELAAVQLKLPTAHFGHVVPAAAAFTSQIDNSVCCALKRGPFTSFVVVTPSVVWLLDHVFDSYLQQRVAAFKTGAFANYSLKCT